MAISQLLFKSFKKYLKDSESVLELGNQTFVNECIYEFNSELKNFTNLTPVKLYVERLGKRHISIDITGLDGSLPYDLNMEKLPEIGEFDLITNFGTTEHIEPNQYEPFYHIHKLCKLNGLMIHEVPAIGGWYGHCKFYYDENFFLKLSEENDYEILELKRNSYQVGDLMFAVLRKKSEDFASLKIDLESRIHISNIPINIPQYWK